MVNENIINFIKNKRPSITKSSITAYESTLRNLYNKIYDDKDYDLNKFDLDSDEVLKYLQSIEYNKRKSILAALVVITDNKDYREQMLKDIKSYNKEQSKQTKSTKQIESWVDNGDIEKIYNNLEINAKFLYKRKDLSMSDLQEIQNFIIVSLLGGIFIPPRRSKDFTNFKISNIDPNQDNFFNKNYMVFNSYKTAKTYGQQTLKIPIKLNRILKKWIEINQTEYLLFDKDYNPLSNVTLNQRLNKIFNKKVGVNQLRHTYLSEKYGVINNEDKIEDFKAMGSSIQQELVYIKK